MGIRASVWLALTTAACGRWGFASAGDGGGTADGDATVGDAGPSLFTVTVEVVGHGTVTSSPSGIACPGTCQATFAAGTSVTLTAQAVPGDLLLGWDGGDCYTSPTCVVSHAFPTIAARFTGAYNVVFVSSTKFAPTAMTLAAADMACANDAAVAGLPGTYRAWLSTSTVNAISRLGSASGWIAMDGLPFAATQADLVTGNTVYPPRLDLMRRDPYVYYTGTAANGTYSGFDCTDWTSTTTSASVGYSDGAGSDFTSEGTPGCNVFGPTPVLCFGVDYQQTVHLTPQQGRLAFLSTPWSPGGGLASADAHCQADASAASLAGTYKALLAYTGGNAQDRFDLTGPTWVRRDGNRIVPNAAQLGPAGLLSPLDMLASGATANASVAFTGNATTTCNDWTDTSSSLIAGGQPRRAAYYWDTAGLSCNWSEPIYCLQE
jgi:hypothetical protein